MFLPTFDRSYPLASVLPEVVRRCMEVTDGDRGSFDLGWALKRLRIVRPKVNDGWRHHIISSGIAAHCNRHILLWRSQLGRLFQSLVMGGLDVAHISTSYFDQLPHFLVSVLCTLQSDQVINHYNHRSTVIRERATLPRSGTDSENLPVHLVTPGSQRLRLRERVMIGSVRLRNGVGSPQIDTY